MSCNASPLFINDFVCACLIPPKKFIVLILIDVKKVFVLFLLNVVYNQSM